MGYLIVFIGSGFGGMLRYGISVFMLRRFGMAFPYGTLLINVVGCLAMGILAEFFLARSGLSQDLKLFLTTGIIAGFTTFSTFSLDTVLLVERGQWNLAALYVVASFALSIAALVSGVALVRTFASGVAA